MQPGPFKLQTSANVGVSPGVYDFTHDAQALQGDLDVVGAGWDSIISDMSNFAVEPADVTQGFDVIGILADVGAIDTGLPMTYLSDIDAGWTSSQQMLSDAISFAPTQSWADPGQPFSLPDSATILRTPTVDSQTYTQAPNQVVGQTTEGRNPGLGLFNSTRLGAQNFSVGDEFDVVGLGLPGSDVVVESSLNGEQLPQNLVGVIDDHGQFFLHGTMGPESVGVWTQRWYIAGQIMASFNFTVSP